MKLASVILVVLIFVTAIESRHHGHHEHHGHHGKHGNWWKKHATCQQKFNRLNATVNTILESSIVMIQSAQLPNNTVYLWDTLHHVTRFLMLKANNIANNLNYNVVKKLKANKKSMDWNELPNKVKNELKTKTSSFYLNLSFKDWGWTDDSSYEAKSFQSLMQTCANSEKVFNIQCLKDSMNLIDTLRLDMVINKELFKKNVQEDISEMKEKLDKKFNEIKNSNNGFWSKIWSKILKKWTNYKKHSRKNRKPKRYLRKYIKYIEKYYFNLIVKCKGAVKNEKRVIKKNVKSAIRKLVELGVMKRHRKRPHRKH